METFFIVAIIITGFTAYWFGKFQGVRDTFNKLEEEGKIISKEDLKDLAKYRN